jgi:hypothetical protein
MKSELAKLELHTTRFRTALDEEVKQLLETNTDIENVNITFNDTYQIDAKRIDGTIVCANHPLYVQLHETLKLVPKIIFQHVYRPDPQVMCSWHAGQPP